MSVSHPIIRELKGYASKLLSDCPKPIKDHEPTLKDFCECFERILWKGLIPYETLVLILTPDCWHWLRNLGEEKCGVPYSYVSSVEDVLANPRVETNRGKSRLLIRTCLVKKCLHFPVQYLVNEGRCSMLYKNTSILGDPILASVLTSILLCLSTVSFDLNLENAQFLDTSWDLPEMVSFTFVPAQCLGLSIMFADGKAVIISVLENSVAEENGEIEVGDIVDSVNGRIVDKRCQGSLSKIVKKMIKNPLNVSFIKGKLNGKPYPPILHYWQLANLDPAVICCVRDTEEGEISQTRENLNGIVYLGSVNTGNKCDLKQIHMAIQNLPDCVSPLPVTIECHHLGLRVLALTTQELITEHNYMDISACGCSQSASPYFAFIAGDKEAGPNNFICYVFKSSESQVVSSFLDTIGQGFKRTLYTV